MRNAALNQVYEIAKQDERVVFIGSDLGKGTLAKFKTEMPGRFFMEGVSEQNLAGVSAGMALEGSIVYFNTISTFITRRCFEQVALDLCLHKANVRLLGNGGGLVYAPLGPTHLAIEDLAILRTLPGMTVIAPCDPEEMKRAVTATLHHEGPVYLRIARGGEIVVSKPENGFEIGKGIIFRDPGEVLIITTGVTLKMALDAADEMAAHGRKAGVLHLHTVKPIDKKLLLEAAAPASAVITVEEHSIIGGLGSAVAEILMETDFDSPKRFRRIGIKDEFPEEFGNQASQMAHFNISAANIVKTAGELLGTGAR